MNRLTLTLMLLLSGCGSAKHNVDGGKPGIISCLQRGESEIPLTPHYDSKETLSWGNKDLRIVVIGHVWDLFYPVNLTAQQDAYIDFVNTQNPDVVIFGGDSLHGPLDEGCDYKTLDANWAALDAFKAKLNARVLMVAGNHDGYGDLPDMYAASYAKFTSENKINYAIDVEIYSRHVGLFLFFEGDSAPNSALIAPLMATASQYDEVLAFGGESTEVPGWLDALNSSTSGYFKYFSGDFQRDSSAVYLPHVEVHNSFAYCNNGFDADLITINATGSVVTPLGHCNR